jgi:integrase
VKRIAWGYTLQVNGRQERKFSVAWTKDDAQNDLAARLLQRDAPAAPAAPRTTLAQVATEYVDYKRAKGKRSLASDETFIGRFKVFFGAETPIADITAQQIARYDSDRLTQASRLGRPITPSSVNRELACLRHMLHLAEEWGYIAKAPRIRMAREPEGRLRFLSDDEAARLLAACSESKNPYLTTIVTMAIHTGMRRGEILGLTWDRVDFSRGVLLVDRTKSGRRREIPMNRAVYDALSGLPGPRDGLLFHRGGAAWGAIRTAFESACTRAKVSGCRFHDLRHTCASWLVMRGRSLKEIQELLGHQTFAMTLRYAHLSPDRLRDAVASLERPAEASNSAQNQHKLVESAADAP